MRTLVYVAAYNKLQGRAWFLSSTFFWDHIISLLPFIHENARYLLIKYVNETLNGNCKKNNAIKMFLFFQEKLTDIEVFEGIIGLLVWKLKIRSRYLNKTFRILRCLVLLNLTLICIHLLTSTGCFSKWSTYDYDKYKNETKAYSS